jgi:hypothetical protein
MAEVFTRSGSRRVTSSREDVVAGIRADRDER